MKLHSSACVAGCFEPSFQHGFKVTTPGCLVMERSSGFKNIIFIHHIQTARNYDEIRCSVAKLSHLNVCIMKMSFLVA